MSITMAKPKKKQEEESPPVYPSRAGYKGTYLPKAVYDELETFATDDDRSVAYLVRRACELYLVQLRKKKAESK